MTTVDKVDDFTDVEANTLVQCERVIERGLKTFVEVGTALAAIRDGRLYRTEYDSFEAYCEQRWAISRPRAYQLMAAAEVVSTTVDTGYRPPSNEAQARELGRAPEDQRGEVWREANERANGRPTAATVREVVHERQMPQRQEVADQIVAGIDAAIKNGRAAGEHPVQESPAACPPPAGDSTPEDDARRYAELDAELADTATRFRANFSSAIARADDVWQFDVHRIVEVYATDFDRAILPFLNEMTKWCAAVLDARREQQTSGLRVINGGGR